MAHLLEKKNILAPESRRKKDRSSRSENKERCHALVAGSSNSSSFIIDSKASRHMAFVKDFFTSMYLDSGRTVRMGDDLDIQAKEIGRIDLEDGYFNNILFVPVLAANLLSMYQMTHTGQAKRVTFTPDEVEIAEISSNKVVALGYADHQDRMYKFSHFLPYSRGNVLLTHANKESKLWHERFSHINYRYLHTLSK